MAHHKSALKRIRQNEVRNARNRALRSGIRTEIKKFRAILDEGDYEKAQAALPGISSAIMKMRSKGIFPTETAARRVSRLALAVNKLKEANA